MIINSTRNFVFSLFNIYCIFNIYLNKMFIELFLFTLIVGLFLGVRWLFAPYFNWKNQQKTVKKDDSIVVITEG